MDDSARGGGGRTIRRVRLRQLDRALVKDLAKEPLWKTVQANPSAVRFPGGESLPEMYARAVTGVRDWDRRVADEHGEDALWVA
jgi:broad specificity phosphatase PhoE